MGDALEVVRKAALALLGLVTLPLWAVCAVGYVAWEMCIEVGENIVRELRAAVAALRGDGS